MKPASFCSPLRCSSFKYRLPRSVQLSADNSLGAQSLVRFWAFSSVHSAGSWSFASLTAAADVPPAAPSPAQPMSPVAGVVERCRVRFQAPTAVWLVDPRVAQVARNLGLEEALVKLTRLRLTGPAGQRFTN
jgi:hypothetical protein